MNNILISIIIPVYNRPDALVKTLNSIIVQTHSKLEILVIDDGSEIEIYPIIRELNDERIKYHKIEHENANVARNYGVALSSGEYIAMLDSDDLWLKTHISDCLEFILNQKTDGIYGSLILKNTKSNHEHQVTVRSLAENETMIDYLLSTGYGAQTSTLFMTAESAKKILWNPQLNRHQDYDFVIRYSKSYRLIAKTTPTVIYTSSESEHIKIDFESCIQVIKENETDISPVYYNNYHLNMLRLATRQQAPNNIIEHYKKEATYYKEHISYFQFLVIKFPQTRFERLKCKLEYLQYILKIEVE